MFNDEKNTKSFFEKESMKQLLVKEKVPRGSKDGMDGSREFRPHSQNLICIIPNDLPLCGDHP